MTPYQPHRSRWSDPDFAHSCLPTVSPTVPTVPTVSKNRATNLIFSSRGRGWAGMASPWRAGAGNGAQNVLDRFLVELPGFEESCAQCRGFRDFGGNCRNCRDGMGVLPGRNLPGRTLQTDRQTQLYAPAHTTRMRCIRPMSQAKVECFVAVLHV